MLLPRLSKTFVAGLGLCSLTSLLGVGIASQDVVGEYAGVPVQSAVDPHRAVLPSSGAVTQETAALQPKVGHPAALATAAPVVATTLLPNWLNSQGSVLEFAQPVGRWLSALNPIAPSTRLATAASQESADSLPGEFVCVEAPERSYANFSEWVAGCLVSEVSDGALRKALAERMESAFRNGQWGQETVEPTLAESFPAARLGDRLLFIITAEVAEAAGVNGEVLATRWVNQLRLVLGDKPLTLLESQFLMHGLKSTGEYLRGEASWYGPYFHGRLTATGEIYDQDMFTAAHKELPFDTYLKVTNTHTGDQLVVRVNDRGPYVGDRILDLSFGAANYLGSKDTGVVHIRAELLEPEDRLQAQLPAFDNAQRPVITMRRP